MKAKRTRTDSERPDEEFLALNEQGWDLVHAIPGRHRYRVSPLLNNPELALWLGSVLQRDERLTASQVRWQSGSVIIEFEPAREPKSSDLLEWWTRAQDRDLPLKEDEARDESAARVAAQEKEWVALDAAAVLARLGIDRQGGVGLEEVEARRRAHGANTLEEVPPSSRWETFTRQFANPQTGLLVGSATLSLATGGIFDVVMISGVLVVNAYIGYLSEAHAEEVIYSIGRVDPFEVQVIRGGTRQSILDEELVVGDLVVLGTGLVPADLRLIESRGLMVDESPLTGESMPVSKHHGPIESALIQTLGDQKNTLFRGTIITSGQGLGVVTATGEQTKIGDVRRLVTGTELQASALEQDLAHIGRQTIWFSSIVCGGVFAIGIGRGISWLAMLKTSISLAVAAVPEGLPTVGTTTMALGVSQLKKRNVLVRRLKVMEMLGSVQVLCLDKTGTLTMNEMIADEGYFGLSHWTLETLVGSGRDKSLSRAEDLATARVWSRIASLCHDCEWLEAVNGDPARWSGSATEKAIIELVESVGVQARNMLTTLPRFRVSYRTEERQYMVTYHNLPNSDLNLAAVKGSPEQLIELCDRYLEKGILKDLDEEAKQRIDEQNRSLGKKGLRVLGFAYLEDKGLRSITDRKLIWVGMVGLMDPMREGMAELIEQFHRAGIKTIMMTGDQSATAKAVGKALGFNEPGEKIKIADARKLSAMTLDEIAELAESVQVFSRVSPSDKLRIVQALQSRGKIVAMTGDGINDSPALKAAHVGIAMGAQGTSAAREAADIVLKDDNIQIIYHAIQHGRTIHSNLRKSIKYLLSTNLSEILLMFGAIAGGRGSPLSSIQLLWINLLSDVLPGLALALDPPSADIMERGPPDPEAPILPLEAQKILFREAGLIATAAFLAHGKYKQDGTNEGGDAKATTAAFISLTISQILHTLSASAEPQGLIRGGLPENKRIYGAMGFAAATLAIGTASPWTRKLLGISSLNQKEWLGVLFQGIWPLMVNEAFTTIKSQKHQQETIH